MSKGLQERLDDAIAEQDVQALFALLGEKPCFFAERQDDDDVIRLERSPSTATGESKISNVALMILAGEDGGVFGVDLEYVLLILHNTSQQGRIPELITLVLESIADQDGMWEVGVGHGSEDVLTHFAGQIDTALEERVRDWMNAKGRFRGTVSQGE